jgi:hypothetical protein
MSLMKTLFFVLLTCSVFAYGESLDSTRMSLSEQEVQVADTPSEQVQQADSVSRADSTMRTWVVPLVLVVAVGTSFFLLFTLRSR